MLKNSLLKIVIYVSCIVGIVLLTSGNLIAGEKLKMKIISTFDQEMTLTAPISGNWEFPIAEFTITLNVESVRRIERTSDGKFKVTLNSGDILKTSQEKEGKISGEGEWGTTRLNWRQVKYAEIIVPDTKSSNTPESKNEKVLQWRVISLSEISVDLWDVQTWDWKFNFQGFTIKVNVNRLKSIRQLAGGEKFRLTFEDGKSFVGTLTKSNALVKGKGQWGQISIPFSKVDQIKRIAKKTQKSKETSENENKPTWELSLKTRLNFNVVKLEGDWSFAIEEFSIDVDPNKVIALKSLTDPDKFQINKNYVTLKNNKTTEVYIKGDTLYGRIKVPWQQISSLIKIGKYKKSDLVSKKKMSIISNSDTSLLTWEVKPDSAKIGEISIEEIRWANIKIASGTKDGLSLKGKDNSELTLSKGKLKGLCSIGEFSIPISSVKEIKMSKSPTSKTSTKKTIGSITLLNGSTIDAIKVEIEGEVENDNNWLKGFMELKKDGFHYWIKKNSILDRGFRSEQDRFYFNVRGNTEDFDKPKHDLKITDYIASFKANLGSILHFVPATSLKLPSPKPKGTITVKAVQRNGNEEIFKARKIWFATYPKYCWSGWYYSWPFRWYREDLNVTRDDDNMEMQIKINKLANIQVVGASYSRKLHFKSLTGAELYATHIWKNLNTDSKKGPSKWDREKEGVLLDLKKDLYVFIPFVAIKQISFVHLSAQINQAQERLKKAGFDPGPIDGVFGSQTKKSLRQYQEKIGLPVTGELDKATLKSLGIK